MEVKELKNLTGGYIPSELNGTEYNYSTVVKNARNITDLPLTFRLWTSGVKNQVDKGTCVAHAMSSMKEIQDYYDSKSMEIDRLGRNYEEIQNQWRIIVLLGFIL